jgi:hypothetical protein
MAHPCFDCGGECYCNGDIDDCIVSKTPGNCEGCGCDQFMSEGREDDDHDDDFDYCSGCGWPIDPISGVCGHCTKK